MKSFIIAPQWIGDAVMTEPFLRALSARGEQLSVLALPWVAPIYRAMAHISSLSLTIDAPFHHGGLQWQARRDLATRIQSGEWGRFDRAYVLPNSLKSALLPWLANIPVRVGYTGEMRFGLLTKRLPNPPRQARGSMVAHYLALADVGATSQWGANPVLTSQEPWVSPALLAAIQPQTYTVIAPGAEYGPAKRWPLDRFASLIAQLPNSALLLGSAKEVALCDAIRSAALQAAPKQNVINLAGQTTLADAIHLIASAKDMVSNDSGLMHVAAAFGIPQVAIFGSSDPRHTPPLNVRAKVLWFKDLQGLDCSPCFQRDCPKAGDEHLRCLKNITSAQVLHALN